MPKRSSSWKCNICDERYARLIKAGACEEKGLPQISDYPVGMMFGAPFITQTMVFAVSDKPPFQKGHFAHIPAWAWRDNGCGDDVGERTCEGITIYRRVSNQNICPPNKNTPAFKRMVNYLCAQGIQPYIWKYGKARRYGPKPQTKE